MDPMGEGLVEVLRRALEVSPDNVPLRRHLADTLRSFGRFEEAELEYRAAMKTAPSDAELQLALATCYAESGKDSHALVLLDRLALGERMSAAAHLLHARLLHRGGELDRAAGAYRRAVTAEPELADEDLAAELNVAPGGAPEGSTWEEGEERQRLRAGPGEDGEGDPDEAARSIWETEVETPDLTFDDVGGMQPVKEEIDIKIIQPLAHPEMFKAYGKTIGGGILMYGPPGCGKTHLARATAGQVKARFLSIGIHDVLEMWIGASERNLHGLFEEARRRQPCVLFFDEVDALGAKRSDMAGGASRQIINQFLAELDGAQSSNEGLLILAATNAPWHVDPAFRRPGRFDRILFVPPPDEAARADILRTMLAGKPQASVDVRKLAKKTVDFSGADLKAVVERAVEAKLREAMKTGRPEPLVTRDLAAAAKQVHPSTREWFATARNHVLYSNQGGAYDDVARYMGL